MRGIRWNGGREVDRIRWNGEGNGRDRAENVRIPMRNDPTRGAEAKVEAKVEVEVEAEVGAKVEVEVGAKVEVGAILIHIKATHIHIHHLEVEVEVEVEAEIEAIRDLHHGRGVFLGTGQEMRDFLEMHTINIRLIQRTALSRLEIRTIHVSLLAEVVWIEEACLLLSLLL